MKCSLAQDKSPCLLGKEGAARAGGNNSQKITNRWELEHTGPREREKLQGAENWEVEEREERWER